MWNYIIINPEFRPKINEQFVTHDIIKISNQRGGQGDLENSEKHAGDARGYLYCLRKFFNLFFVIVVSSCCCKLLANLL